MLLSEIDLVALHEKPYFPGSGISWRAQKDQVNTTCTSTFWLKKDRIFHPLKIQNNGSLATSKLCSILKKISYCFCFVVVAFFLRTEI